MQVLQCICEKVQLKVSVLEQKKIEFSIFKINNTFFLFHSNMSSNKKQKKIGTTTSFSVFGPAGPGAIQIIAPSKKGVSKHF